MNRRGFLGMAAGAALGVGAFGTGLISAVPAMAATTLTPDQALEKLKAGNLKYQKAPEGKRG